MGKFYITTSIMYVNSDPHLGFAMELAQADVLARWHRLGGDEVFFLTGADEHGKKISEAARKAGVEAQQFVDEKSKRIKDLAKELNISNDFFIRTTDKKNHWPTVERVWGILKEKGDIYEKDYEGRYCVGCEAFLSDRELIDGKCEVHLKEPEIIKEENYFFKLSKYLPDVQSILKENKIKIYPNSRKQEALNMIKDGIGDLSVSRPVDQVSWGMPVPGDDSQNIYVWFEALLNYISALDYAKNGKEFEKYWPADVHLIGKDIFKFHVIIWPAILLATGIELPKTILVHDFITVDGRKMSKSLGNVVSPSDVISKYGSDAFRYFFLGSASLFSEIDFTEEKFSAKYTADLSNGLGNLVSRILNIAKKNEDLLGEIIVGDDSGIIKPEIWKKYAEHIENYEFEKALSIVWGLVASIDKHIEDIRLWELPKQENSHKDFKKYITEHINNLFLIAEMIEPFMPETSEKIFFMIGIKKIDKKSYFPVGISAKSAIKQKIKIGEIKPLFPRIEAGIKE